MNGITFPKNSATSNPRAVQSRMQLGSERSSSLNTERAESPREVRLEAGKGGQAGAERAVAKHLTMAANHES